jgi:hypothetical protein
MVGYLLITITNYSVLLLFRRFLQQQTQNLIKTASIIYESKNTALKCSRLSELNVGGGIHGYFRNTDNPKFISYTPTAFS